MARSPVSAGEGMFKKHARQLKARMDQRTRERLPVLPKLVRAVDQQLKDARARLAAVQAAVPGARFTVLGETYTKAVTSGTGKPSRTTTAYSAQGRRVDLAKHESKAFWAWAAVEFLRHTGVFSGVRALR